MRFSSRAIQSDLKDRGRNKAEPPVFQIGSCCLLKPCATTFSFSFRLLNVLLVLVSIPWHLRWYHNEPKWISHALYAHFNHFFHKSHLVLGFKIVFQSESRRTVVGFFFLRVICFTDPAQSRIISIWREHLSCSIKLSKMAIQQVLWLYSRLFALIGLQQIIKKKFNWCFEWLLYTR